MAACAFTIVLGDQAAYHCQAWYALLSLRAHAAADVDVAVVTDQPQRYGWFGDAVRVFAVDAATVGSWSGPHRFRWRFKPKAMQLVAARHPGALLYLDSDVQCRADPAPLLAGLDAGACAMHLREQVLSASRRRGDRRLYAAVGDREFAGCRIDRGIAMWNAGIVAVGAVQRGLIDRSLEVLDAMCGAGAAHNLSEQLAFSAVLAASGRLIPADAWFDHYWGNKPAWQAQILERLADIQQLGLDPRRAAGWLRDRPIRLPLRVRHRWWNRLAARWAQGSVVP